MAPKQFHVYMCRRVTFFTFVVVRDLFYLKCVFCVGFCIADFLPRLGESCLLLLKLVICVFFQEGVPLPLGAYDALRNLIAAL